MPTTKDISSSQRSLPVVGQEPTKEKPKRRHPSWIKVAMPTKASYFDVKKRVEELNLNTVCASASCPNIGECWTRRALTIMILGDICTRSCRFCDVKTGRPLPVDTEEPTRVAQMLGELDLEHTVITCVDRDDLSDGGAAHWAETITKVRASCPSMSIEILTGDFKGNTDDVDTVLDAQPDVFSHNLETVPTLSREVRVQASYPRSYRILKHARDRNAITKTGLMLGVGEDMEEVRDVVRELAKMRMDILTFGQYLQPSRKHLPVARYVHPDEFAELAKFGMNLGIAHVEAGPLVRSSYHADGQADMIRRIRATRG